MRVKYSEVLIETGIQCLTFFSSTKHYIVAPSYDYLYNNIQVVRGMKLIVFVLIVLAALAVGGCCCCCSCPAPPRAPPMHRPPAYYYPTATAIPVVTASPAPVATATITVTPTMVPGVMPSPTAPYYYPTMPPGP